MKSDIKKRVFKSSIGIQIEIISMEILISRNFNALLAPHRTNFYHIFIFQDCAPVHFVDFNPIPVSPFSLLFLDKDRVHYFDARMKYAGKILVFTDNFFCKTEEDTRFLQSAMLFKNLGDQCLIPVGETGLKRFIKICGEIDEELQLPGLESKETILKNLLHNFLIYAEREKYKLGSDAANKDVNLQYALAFKELLEKNYKHTKSVAFYAERIFITKKRLGEATSAVLGKSPKEMVNDRILLEAKRLLAHSAKSVKETGQDLGFEDPAYFVRFFKKAAGETPSDFRSKFRNT